MDRHASQSEGKLAGRGKQRQRKGQGRRPEQRKQHSGGGGRGRGSHTTLSASMWASLAQQGSGTARSQAPQMVAEHATEHAFNEANATRHERVGLSGAAEQLRRQLNRRHVATGQLFACMDADRNNLIDFAEFKRGVAMVRSPPPPPRRRRFAPKREVSQRTVFWGGGVCGRSASGRSPRILPCETSSRPWTTTATASSRGRSYLPRCGRTGAASAPARPAAPAHVRQ